jgi:hypothetical protein
MPKERGEGDRETDRQRERERKREREREMAGWTFGVTLLWGYVTQ